MIRNALAILIGIVTAQSALGSCVAFNDVLVVMKIHHCQQVTISADQFSDETDIENSIHTVGSSITGALVTGEILESSQIVTDQWRSGAESAYQIEAESTGTLFLNTDSVKYCSSVKPRSKRWYITDTTCCDTLPVFGLCLIPEGLPIVKPAPKPGDQK